MRLIDADALKEEFAKHEDRKGYLIGDWEEFIDNAPTIEDLSEYSDKLWKKAYERGKAAGHDREELIREKLKDITIVKQDGKYRPVKNTSSQECYRVIYEINRLLKM